MSEKVTRKELLKKEDAFLHAAGESAVWLRTHKVLVIGLAVAAVAAVVLVWGGIEYQRGKEAEASALFIQAVELKEAPVLAEGEKAEDSTAKSFPTNQARDEAALQAFNKVAEAAPSTGVATLARFAAADLQASLGQTDKALADFEQLLSELSSGDNLYFLAVERVAYIQEQKGQLDQALATWNKLPTKAESFYGDRALYQRARLHIEKGEGDKGRELLTQLEKDFTKTTLKDDVTVLWGVVGRPQVTPEGVASGKPEEKAKP